MGGGLLEGFFFESQTVVVLDGAKAKDGDRYFHIKVLLGSDQCRLCVLTHLPGASRKLLLSLASQVPSLPDYSQDHESGKISYKKCKRFPSDVS